MAHKEKQGVKPQTQYQLPHLLQSLVDSIKPLNPRLTPSPSGPPASLWPEPTRLPRTTNDDRRIKWADEGLRAMKSKGATARITGTEIAMDPDDSPSSGSSSATHYREASSAESASSATCYSSNSPSSSTAQPLEPPKLNAPSLIGWTSYPPLVVPRFDLSDPAPSSGKGLRDIEELTDEHIKQSTALREWMEVVNDERESGQESANNEQTKTNTVADGDTMITDKDQAINREIQQTYAAFVNMEACEAHASVCRRASEALYQKPGKKVSKVERLLGSDGSATSSNPYLPKDNQLYFIGSPPQLSRIPFDEAVAAGYENVRDPHHPLPPSLPIIPRAGPPRPRIPVPGAPFLFETLSTPRYDAHIPDWFGRLQELTLPLEGRTEAARWASLLRFIGALRKEIDETRPQWEKHWHNPSRKWAQPHRQRHGGWWKCRSGPDAPEAEAGCRICHVWTIGHQGQGRVRVQDEAQDRVSDLQAELDGIMGKIAKAMAEVAEDDKKAALEMIRLEREKFIGGKGVPRSFA